MKIKIKLLGNLLLSTTAKNTYVVFIGNSLSTFFAFIFTITLVRILTVSDYGFFSALWSFLLLVSDVSDIGIGSSLSRFLPPLSHDWKRLYSFFKTSFYLQLAIATLVTLLIFIFSKLLAQILIPGLEDVNLIRIIGFGIWGSIMTTFILFAFSAKQKFFRAALLTTVTGLFRLLSLLPIILLAQASLKNVVWMQTLSLILSTFIALLLLGPKFLSVKRTKGDIRSLISFSMYLGIARALTAISSRLDVLMLISLTNSYETGIYAIAARIISVYPVFTGSFSTVLAPKLATIDNFSLLRKFISKVILATIALIASIIILMIIAEPFLVILFSAKAQPATSVFRLLLLAMIFFVGSLPAVSLAIYYLKKPYILTLNSIIQLLTVFIGNLIFIPIYGKKGAAFSLILAFGITLFLTSMLSYYHLKKKHEV